MLTLVMLFGLNAWGATTLFHETFGNNSEKARDWKDSYSVKSGIGAVYSSVGYTITNAKQSKNTVGAVKSGLTQTTSNKDASIVIGPLNAAACSEMVLTYKWNAGSTKGTYSTSASYATSVDGKYTALTCDAKGATSFVECKYTLPVEAQVSTLYLKIVWNTSNTQAVIDEVDLSGVYSESGFVAKPEIKETSKPDLGSSYLTTSTATATIACDDKSATIKYAITGDDVKDAATIKSWTEGASVSIRSEVAGTKILWAKAVKEGKESAVASKEFTFATEPEGTYFVLVTDASQIVEGAKYVITSETDDAAMLGWETGDNNCKPQSVTASNGVLELPSDFTGIITLGKTETGYTLKQLNGLYLTATGTDKNYLVAKSALVDNSYWKITIGNDYVASIKNVKNTSRGVMQYNSSSTLFACYNGESQESLHLYRMAKEVPVATKTGLDAVLAGKVNVKYQINTPLCVNYKDANYVYASTIGGGSTKTTPTEAQKKEWWSDKEDGSFNQNDWVAIQGLDVEVGAEIEAGSVATLVSKSEFPVIKFDSMKSKSVTAIKANTYRVANFNIGVNSPLVSKLWLVAPQPAEYCKVKGYVDATTDVKTNYLFAKTGSEATEIEGTSYDPLKMTVNLDAANEKITKSGWYVFEGIVVNNGTIRELNAISATAGSIETVVEGVETSSVKVYGAEGVINVESEEVAPIAVYSANGAIVSSIEASSASIAVAPGFYIVKAGNSVSKVTVK